jgi:hypothetical protein
VTKRRSREAISRQFPGIRIAGDEVLDRHALPIPFQSDSTKAVLGAIRGLTMTFRKELP